MRHSFKERVISFRVLRSLGFKVEKGDVASKQGYSEKRTVFHHIISAFDWVLFQLEERGKISQRKNWKKKKKTLIITKSRYQETFFYKMVGMNKVILYSGVG